MSNSLPRRCRRTFTSPPGEPVRLDITCLGTGTTEFAWLFEEFRLLMKAVPPTGPFVADRGAKQNAGMASQLSLPCFAIGDGDRHFRAPSRVKERSG